MKGSNRIFWSITAAAVAAGCLASASVGVWAESDWNGGTDTSWYNTDDTGFVLTEPEELAGLAKLVNEGTDSFAGKTVSLGSDICFFEFADAEAWADGILIPDTTWTPIGNTYGTPFKGVFDGCGYTVSGICVIEYDTVAGFFGYAGSGSEIRNLNLESSYIYSNGTFSGGICAYNHVAAVRDCKSSAAVCSDYYIAGGICGVNMGGNVVSSYNTGSITGGTAAGGIAGEQCSYGKASGCYNTGSVGSNTAAGGIAGRCGDSTIRNCYNTGNISGKKIAGGISGDSVGDNELQNCYNSGSVTCTSGTSGGVTGDTGTVCYNCCYLASSAEAGCAETGAEAVTAEALADGTAAEKLGEGFVQGTDTPVLTWQDSTVPIVTTTTPAATTTTAKTTTTTKTTTTAETTTASKTTASASGIKIWAVNNDTALDGAGDTVQLLIDGNVNTPQWATMNSAVAVVDEYGLVTAVGEGTVVIVAMVDGIAAELTLTVGSAATTAKTTETTAKTTSTTTKTSSNTTAKTTASTTKTASNTTAKTTSNTTSQTTATTAKTTVKTTATTSKTTAKTSTTAKTTAASTTTTPKVTIKAYSLGDCDGNQSVELNDAAEALRYYACQAASIEVYFNEDAALDMLAFYAADVTRDGEIGLDDAAAILQYYAKKAAGLAASWN